MQRRKRNIFVERWKYQATFVYDFLSSANPIVGGGTTSATIDADGTYIDSSGSPVQKTSNVWPLEYDQSTLLPLGRPIFEARTNLFLNSLLNGTSLSTQSVTLTAAAHTLSFTGTGTVTLSGTATGSLVGTGANTRVTLTFTPTAGSVTFTVSGTVKWAQVELGATVTPFIPTAGVAVARAADVLTLSLGSWFNASEGTFMAEYVCPGAAATNILAQCDDGSNNNRIVPFLDSGAAGRFFVATAGVTQAIISSGGVPRTTPLVNKMSAGYIVNNFSVSGNGFAAANDASGTVPAGLVTLRLGTDAAGGAYLNGWIRRLTYYNTRLDDSRLVSLSK